MKPGGKIWTDFRPKTAILLHRCAMIEKVFFDTMSDFARILALCRAWVITISTIRMGVIECKLPMGIVGIVITRARHSAKIRAKKRYSTAHLALEGCDKLRTVCTRTVRLSVPVIYFRYRAGSTRDYQLLLYYYCNYYYYYYWYVVIGEVWVEPVFS
jgi:hypothetical protein